MPRLLKLRRGWTLPRAALAAGATYLAASFVPLVLLTPSLITVRHSGERHPCISNMHQIVQALKMYRDDWGVYPDALYGISRDGATVEPRLAHGFVKEPGVFTCPGSPVKPDSNRLVRPVDPMIGQSLNYWLPAASSYDVQWVPARAGGRPELRYARTRQGAAHDLSAGDPSEDTVVTWCLYHSGMDSRGRPAAGSMAPVAFLSGRVQTLDARKLVHWSGPPYPWQVAPKP